MTGLLELIKDVLLATITISLIALLVYYAVLAGEVDP